MKQWLSVVAICLLATGTSAAQTGGTAKGTTGRGDVPDSAFARQAAADSTAEVEHGRLATQNASSADVKQFAQHMVDDHSKANTELKSIASQKQLTIPTELTGKHKAMQDKLSKLKGAEFDKAYMAHMVTAHQQAVSLFEREAKTGKDDELKAWAEKTLPTLQEHLKQARDINAKLGKAK
jgi:putative membrane protein